MFLQPLVQGRTASKKLARYLNPDVYGQVVTLDDEGSREFPDSIRDHGAMDFPQG